MINQMDLLQGYGGELNDYENKLISSENFYNDNLYNNFIGLQFNNIPNYYDDRIKYNLAIERGQGISLGRENIDTNGTLVGIDLSQPTIINPIPHKRSSFIPYNIDAVTPINGGNYPTDSYMLRHTLNGGAFNFSSILNFAKKLFNTGKKIVPHVKKGIETGKKIYDTGKKVHEFTKNPSIKNITNIIKDVKEGVDLTKNLINTGKEAYKDIKNYNKPEEEDEEFFDAEGTGRRKRRRKTISNNDMVNLLTKIHQVL